MANSVEAEVKSGTTKAVKSVANVVSSVGKDIVAVAGIVGSVLAAAGGVVPADVALYVVSGIAVLRTLGEDLEKQ